MATYGPGIDQSQHAKSVSHIIKTLNAGIPSLPFPNADAVNVLLLLINLIFFNISLFLCLSTVFEKLISIIL